MNRTEQSAGSQFSPMRSTTCAPPAASPPGTGRRPSSSTHYSASSPVVRGQQQAQPGPGGLRVDALDDGKRVGDVGAAPADAGMRHLEVAAGRGAAAAHADAGRRHAEALAGLVLGQHAGDVVIDHDHLIHLAVPLLREDADGGAAAADPHARARRVPLTMGACAGLHAPPLRRHRWSSSTASPLHSASRAAQVALPSRLLPPVRCRTPPRESIWLPYSAVVTWPTCSPSARTAAALGAEVAVGVDLHLHAAIAEDALGHDGDGIHAGMLRGRR